MTGGGPRDQRQRADQLQAPAHGPAGAAAAGYGADQAGCREPLGGQFAGLWPGVLLSCCGDLKVMLSLVTGLWPKEQRLLYRGKEHEESQLLLWWASRTFVSHVRFLLRSTCRLAQVITFVDEDTVGTI